MFEQALTSNAQNGHAWLCMTVFVLYIKLHDYRQKRTTLPLTNRIALRFFHANISKTLDT